MEEGMVVYSISARREVSSFRNKMSKAARQMMNLVKSVKLSSMKSLLWSVPIVVIEMIPAYESARTALRQFRSNLSFRSSEH